ncbi:TPA: Ribulose bisphosphate carboxylase small subunit, chloroplastic 4 [Trebouxia sp. C0004]
MASACASLVAPVASAKVAVPAKQTSFNGLARMPFNKVQKNSFAQRTVSNGIKTRQMLVWQPTNNKMFETLSFLPPLDDDAIAKQVEYIIKNNWTPCLEFSEPEFAYVKAVNTNHIRGTAFCNYMDNRYWTMYKLPMFGCNDAGQVLTEISNATRSFPDAYIRIISFDPVRQVQMSSLLVHRPPNAHEHADLEDRSK